METADSTTVEQQFEHFLNLVKTGQTIRITKLGRPVARLVPELEFMSGKEFAKLFAGYQADALDKATADEVARNIAQFDAEVDDALAH